MKKTVKALFVVMLILICLFLASTSWAATAVTLAWDASPDVDVTGYKIYWGTTPQGDRTGLDAGKNLQFPLTGLPSTGPVYCAVAAYTATGESDRSDDLVLWGFTAGADANCTITLSGSQLYSQGGSVTYAIATTGAYKIQDVKVDGQSIGAVSTYTFGSITANHTIAATSTKNITRPKNLRALEMMAVTQKLPLRR